VEKPHNPLRPALAEALEFGPDPQSEPRQLDLTIPLPTDAPSPEESQPPDLLVCRRPPGRARRLPFAAMPGKGGRGGPTIIRLNSGSIIS
jgi:hypothetical protein